ncbi:16S rRNA (uracil(1498)-N(3))-methyltransferase [uncultured Thiothrix sp.]|uniref:16S rRNA (uracil(1498)-N(3))-methyltransferase n=1 Tax=uncultured Thiothrix sp. TaxID=223185 RepID=UPI00261C108E|nr:16S rRNA (uracil(1498)-N(3))-methyltransferase [uncultured Thiothrix sp.]
MRIPRFYCPVPLAIRQSLGLPEEVFRHAIQVLRLQVGESLILFNGEGGEFLAELTEINKRSATALLQSFDPAERESSLELTLVQALVKPDKMDFALQKAVELGISAFQPLITQRSVVRTDKEKIEKKLQHWQAVAISACEQSGRTKLPTIHAPQTLDQYLSQLKDNANYLILAPGSSKDLSQVTVKTNKLAVLIGPEGGFTDFEVSACLAAHIQGITLGERILRAETASTSVIAILQLLHGDLRI